MSYFVLFLFNWLLLYISGCKWMLDRISSMSTTKSAWCKKRTNGKMNLLIYNNTKIFFSPFAIIRNDRQWVNVHDRSLHLYHSSKGGNKLVYHWMSVCPRHISITFFSQQLRVNISRYIAPIFFWQVIPNFVRCFQW